MPPSSNKSTRCAQSWRNRTASSVRSRIFPVSRSLTERRRVCPRTQAEVMRHATLLGSLASLLTAPIAVTAQAPTPAAPSAVDAEYTAKIRELTPTDPKWKFTTELVDYLPASATVPTPLKVLGYVPGTTGRLSKTADVNRYFRALAAASPRVKVFTLGRSDEGKEMIAA